MADAAVFQRVMAGVVVDDLPAACAWYERVLGRPPDAAPMDGLFEWHLAESGWVQLVDLRTVREVMRDPGWGSAGSSSISIVIDDLDRQIDLFRDAGIPVGPVYTTKTAGKTATVRDPAGNIVRFVEPPREG